MATHYTLVNATTGRTIPVDLQDYQTLSPDWAKSGWSIQSQYSDPASPAGGGFGFVTSPPVGTPAGYVPVVQANGSVVYSAGGSGTVDTVARASLTGGVLPTVVASLTPATTSAAPVAQRLNLYDATAGNLTPPIPLANSVPAGTVVGFKKTDASVNLVSPTCSGSDHIGSSGGGTSIPIRTQDQMTYLATDGVSVWSKVNGDLSLPSLTSYLGGVFAPIGYGGSGAATSVIYTAGAYAARSTVTSSTTTPVIWVGPVDPAASGALAVDIWENTGVSV